MKRRFRDIPISDETDRAPVERVVCDARLAGDDNQRRALIAERLIKAAKCVAGTDAAVELHGRRLLRRHA